MKKYDVIIVGGGGPAGRTIVNTLYEGKSSLSVLVIKKDKVDLTRCTIPYGMDYNEPRQKFTVSNDEITEKSADILFGEVTSIDSAAKTLKVNDAETSEEQTLEYDKLVITTGAKAVVPKIDGVEASNITTVYSLDDLEQLRQLTSSCRKALVLGGSFIGIEIAVALKKLGVDVTLVEKKKTVLDGVLEPEFISEIENILEDNEIKISSGCTVSSFKLRNGRAVIAKLDNERLVEADFFAIAAGIAPNTDLAEKAGIKVSENGIIVDNDMQTSAKDIYAAGDCAEIKSFISGKPVKSKFATTAVFTARAAALSILGKENHFKGIVDARISTAFDLSFGFVGLTEELAKDYGHETIVGFSRLKNGYKMLEKTSTIDTKLVFDKNSHVLLGGCVLRNDYNSAANLDILSLACQKEMTLEELMDYQYTTHPKLAAEPMRNMFIEACKDALQEEEG